MNRKRVLIVAAILAIVVVAIYAVLPFRISEALIGYQEVPSISTTGNGTFDAVISEDGTRVNYVLSYADLEGSVQQSHIHLGQPGVNGGISVFLCSNLGNGPAGTQACPPAPATISGVITAADVSPNIAATAGARQQGLDTGEMNELVAAMRAGYTYANVHSTKWPGGEIRAQIHVTDLQNGTEITTFQDGTAGGAHH
jgi:hypothetical protein